MNLRFRENHLKLKLFLVQIILALKKVSYAERAKEAYLTRKGSFFAMMKII